jgi:single-stranded DNA-binding protein
VLGNLTELVVLVNRRKQDDAGEWVNTDTSRFTVKTFRTIAEKAAEQLHKGDRILAIGSVVTDTWTDADTQQNRHKQFVLADAVAKSL